MKSKKLKIKNLLNAAKKELLLFKKTNNFTNLSQACEKSWVAFTLLVEYKSGKEARAGKTIKTLAYNLGLGELFQNARYLHVIHYEGSPDTSFDELVTDVEDVIFELQRLIKQGL